MEEISESSLFSLFNKFPRNGQVVWIGVRPERRMAMQELNEVQALTGKGLVEDRFAGRPGGKRQVTLLQAEHLEVIGSFLGKPTIEPSLLRRNILVKGINLLSLKEKQFWVGDALLEMTGLCHPCSYMEEVLGEGGYNAMRGHGGITARVIKNGWIKIGDKVFVETQEK